MKDKGLKSWHLRRPLFESPFPFKADDDTELIRMSYTGYLIFDSEIPESILDEAKKDTDKLIKEENTKFQEKGYHYSDSPRVFEGWKKSKAIRFIATNTKVLSKLEYLYGAIPFPFQTINFSHGTNQPLHSDTIHFHSYPPRWLAAAWTALEDHKIGCGTLQIVPGSHRLECFNFDDLSIDIPSYGNQFDAYHQYEDFIKNIVSKKEIKEIYLKKGQTIIWAANLIHGGAKIIDPSLTRYSQASHYYFKGCSRYYSPMFSRLSEGHYSDKNLKEKDILGWLGN